jgi:hypothetical protein
MKRRAAKVKTHRITPEAIEAFRAGDYDRLHRALGLPPWHPSPLPLEVHGLGVNQRPVAPAPGGCAWAEFWPAAQELQRLLKEAAESVGSAIED